jgi:hypothetical protein
MRFIVFISRHQNTYNVNMTVSCYFVLNIFFFQTNSCVYNNNNLVGCTNNAKGKGNHKLQFISALALVSYFSYIKNDVVLYYKRMCRWCSAVQSAFLIITQNIL